jgi:hypothetical protein
MRGKEISWATIYSGGKERKRVSGQVRDNVCVCACACTTAAREGTYTGDRYAGEAEVEELVEAGNEDGPEETDEPGAEGGAWHVWVVGVGDGSTDLGVWGVVLEVVDVIRQVGVVKVGLHLDGGMLRLLLLQVVLLIVDDR